jgi:hypothetical protein
VPGSSISIVTDYGLEGPGIESWWGWNFPHLSRPALGAHPASCTMDTKFFPVVKSGRGVTLTPHPLLVLWSWKGRAMYLYFCYGPYGLYRASVPVQGCTLPYRRAITLLPLWAKRPVQSLSACTRVTYTFTFTYGNTLLVFYGRTRQDISVKLPG